MTMTMTMWLKTARQRAMEYGDGEVDTGRYVGALRVARRRWRNMWDLFTLAERVSVVREQFRYYYGF